MFGIVVVSHSRPLADAAVAMASALVEPDRLPTIEVASGSEGHALGTDSASIALAIQRVDSGEGVLVLLDHGTAVLSTQLAVGFLDADLAERVEISPGPLVEGLIAAVAAAAGGASLREAAQRAGDALAAKRRQLGEPEGDGESTADAAAVDSGSADLGGEDLGADLGDAAPAAFPADLAPARPDGRRPVAPAKLTWRTQIVLPHGIHIRPAAAIVTALREVDADVLLGNATSGRGPVPATSISRITSLEVQPGHILEARITGREAERARAVLADLAARGYGEGRARPARPVRDPISPAEWDEAEPTHVSGSQVPIGPIHRRTAVPNVDGYHPRGPKDELARFTAAVDQVIDYLEALARARPVAGGILEAQALLAGDREFAHDVVGRITEGFGAVDAVIEFLTRIARRMDGLTDPYLRERAQDVRSVRRLLLLALMGRPLTDDEPGEPCIWLVDELDAASASRLDQRLCLGVITTSGGLSGHGALTAEARGIPVLTGRADAASLTEGQLVGFDPVTRELWVDPSPATQAQLAQRNHERAEAQASALARAHDPAFTLTGERILVEANVSSLADAHSGARAGAEGSGVVRTEIIFAARPTAPTAEEQAEVYLAIGRALRGGPISIRTWDAGGDKPLAFLPSSFEANPALGERGLRTMKRARGLFAEQLRGIALAARETPVRVMFPMVTNAAEVGWARGILDDVLREMGPVDLPVGIMIEVPAAAMAAHEFAGLVDYVSVGTNDLAQYVLAIDRTNASVAELAPPDHPAIIQLIEMTCRGLPGIPVAVCGNLASERSATDRLISLGVTELSVRPPLVAQVKQEVRRSGCPPR